MPEVSIKQADRRFLKSLCSEPLMGETDLEALIDRFHPRSTQHSNTLFARFEDAELEEIIDALLGCLVSVGLGGDYEPNSIGLKIEGFIDVFNAPRLD